MLEFKVIELSDKEWITAALKRSDFRGCEYSFANNMAWRRLYDTRICAYKDFYISCSHKRGAQFIFPAGSGDYRDLFKRMEDYARARNSPLVVHSVTSQNLPLFDELYPGRYSVSSDPASFDYIYDAQSLRELKGKKYHGKRNHLNRFYERGASYADLTEKDFDDCIEFAALSYNQSGGYDDASSVAEQYAINTFFTHYAQLGLKGGVIRADGEFAGFTIGEGLNSDTFAVHIEKASSVQGAYAAVNNEFAKAHTVGYKYVNREEDLGIPGLRKAKRSYYPAFLLEKHTVTIDI